MSLFSRISLGVALALALAACGGGAKERPKADIAASKVTTIGVNAYLWRAALDSISFMPLVQADANSGVIIRDWYAHPAAPPERVKVTISILHKDLRADSLRVAPPRPGHLHGQWPDAELPTAPP